MVKAKTTQGYVTDIAYIWGAYNAQNPKEINAVAAFNGYLPVPLDQPFTYCDLGCGNGLTVNFLAAIYPHAQFVGIDFNAAHIENARGFAERAGLDNARFICAGFEAALELDLPAFDVMALHGVYTWVPPDVRRAVVALLERWLKPEGLAYLAYNCMPGWAALEPLRRLMITYGEVVPGSSLERARYAMAYLHALRDNKAAYFAQNPSAGEMLDLLDRQPLPYVAHEYLNESWEPIYFAQMAQELGAAGLTYAGSLPLWTNVEELIIPPELQRLFRSAPDRVVFETHKDFLTNQRFRTDIFTRQAARPRGTADRPGFDALRIVGTTPRRSVSLKLTFPHFEVQLDHPVYPPLMELLAERSWTAGELVAHPGLAEFQPDMIREALQFLLISQQYEVGLADPLPAPEAMPRRARFNDRASARALAELLEPEGRIYLASTVTGRIMSMPLVESLLIASHVEGVAQEARAGWLVDRLAAMGRTLDGPDGPLEGDALLEAAEQAGTNYASSLFPFLWRAGILRGDAP
jgi:SAM-dependent methyltransferase